MREQHKTAREIAAWMIVALFWIIVGMILTSCSAEGIEQDPWPCPKDRYCVSTTYPIGEAPFETVVCECRDPKINEDGFFVVTKCYDLEGNLICIDRSNPENK